MKKFSSVFLIFMLDLDYRYGDIIKETKQWYIVRYKLIDKKYKIVKVRKSCFPYNTYLVTLKLRRIFKEI